MASTSSAISNLSSNLPLRLSSYPNRPLPLPSPFSFPRPCTPKTAGLVLCAAAKSQTGPVNKKKRKNTSRSGGRADEQSNSKPSTSHRRNSDIDYMGEEDGSDEAEFDSMPLPTPPAGFVLDDEGRVLMASKKRIVAIVDPDSNNNPLDCVVRRVFRSSKGDECMVVYPADLPISLLKSTNFDGWTMISDEEIETVLPAADYALAKTHMHLVQSGFFYTARGGFGHNENDVFNISTDEGVVIEALEIVCFHLDDAHYMIYTPLNPLTFVVIKDENGVYRRADDEHYDDPAILKAVDEETEFSAMAQAEKEVLAEILEGGGV